MHLSSTHCAMRDELTSNNHRCTSWAIACRVASSTRSCRSWKPRGTRRPHSLQIFVSKFFIKWSNHPSTYNYLTHSICNCGKLCNIPRTTRISHVARKWKPFSTNQNAINQKTNDTHDALCGHFRLGTRTQSQLCESTRARTRWRTYN